MAGGIPRSQASMVRAPLPVGRWRHARVPAGTPGPTPGQARGTRRTHDLAARPFAAMVSVCPGRITTDHCQASGGPRGAWHLPWAQTLDAGLLGPAAGREDGPLPPSHDATERPCAPTTAAPASRLAGGGASGADRARRVAHEGVRSPARQRVMASVRGRRRAAARQPSGHVAAAGGAPTPSACPSWRARAAGDADGVRAARPPDRTQPRGEPHGVGVRDDPGGVHTGRPAAGVARQDTGPVGHGGPGSGRAGVAPTARHTPPGDLASGRLDAPPGRRRGDRPPLVRLAWAGPDHPVGTRLVPRVAGPAAGARAPGLDRLGGVCPAGHDPAGGRRGRWPPLAHRARRGGGHGRRGPGAGGRAALDGRGRGRSPWRWGRWPCGPSGAPGRSPSRRSPTVGRLPRGPAPWRRARPGVASPPVEPARAAAAVVAMRAGRAPTRPPPPGLVAVASAPSAPRPG
jgi:hypothetical protein